VKAIEAGVAQRARILNALLSDLYGRSGCGRRPPAGECPSAILNYLWPLHDLRPATVLAASLRRGSARAPDGRWWLLADRTQGPSDAGYRARKSEISAGASGGHLPTWRCGRVRDFFGHLRERMQLAQCK